MNKYELAKQITARRKAQFVRECKAAEGTKQVAELAKALAIETAKKQHWDVKTAQDLRDNLYAVGEAVWHMDKAETVQEYLVSYMNWKFKTYSKLNDTGAIGDAIETAVHLLACREIWRTKIQNLHVSVIGRTDVKIGGRRFEVGHNAKVWADSTEDEIMAGPFDGVIYGMIDNETVEQIAEIMEKDLAKGVTELANMLYVFTDKYEFLRFMQEDLGRSATIKYRKDLDCMITVYNGSKQNAFNKGVEEKRFPNLTEYMKALGKNDYLV